MTTIWGSTSVAPFQGTYRMPVDTGAAGTPSYISGSELVSYIEANYSLTFDAAGTGLDSINIKGTTSDEEGTIAIGKSTIATGADSTEKYGIALGHTAAAYQLGSVAIGRNATAGGSGDGSYEECVAVGMGATATLRHAIAIGKDATATTLNGVAIGDAAACTGSGEKGVALGNTAIVTGDRGVAIGSNAEANHDNSIAMGELVTSSQINQFTFGDLALRLGSFAVSALPTASNYTGHVVYCTDGDTGSACLAVSNGTNWKVVALGATVSAT